MGEDVIRILFAQLINLIEFLQEEGIVHRDLKPHNIGLTKNYNIKIISFGRAVYE